MIEVSSATKQAFMSDVSKKELRVVFPQFGVTFLNDAIESETMKITEALSTKDSVEFIGCIASSLQINIYGVDANIKGKQIEVYIRADNTDEIPLFKGIVDSVVIDSHTYFKKVTAYDVLYTLGQTDVATWYHQQFPTDTSTKTIRELRDSLCGFIGLEQEPVDLPNDNIVIHKKFDPKTLQCISVLKSICQINGCCGIVDRNGKFDYRFISGVTDGIYPSLTLYPSASTFPQYSNVAHTFAFYESLNFQEYFVKPIEKIQIRQSEKDEGVTVGDGLNKYIIQANIFAQEIEPSFAREMANNILDKVRGVRFYPFNSKNNGLPFVEVGDAVVFATKSDRTGAYATSKFFVLNRTISGVQLLKDQYSANGSEDQSEFITDLQTTLDTLKLNGPGDADLSDYYTKDQVDDIFDQTPTLDDIDRIVADQVDKMETPTGFNVASVYTLPSTRSNNTIYLIQGGVIIL